MRVEVDDPFGQGEFGSNSGVLVFTDRGRDHIERAVLGRCWGAAQRERIATEYVDPIKSLDAYDIVAEPVRIQEPVSGPVTEYDLRFKGLRAFVDARNPKRIAVNFRLTLGQWPTYSWDLDGDGISHTDFVLLAEELGEEHAAKLESSEYLVMDYAIRKVPSEIELLREMRRLEVQLAYVLRENETEPPEEVKKLWDEYRKVDAILATSIRSGPTPEQIVADYTKQYERAGIIVREDQSHMIQPKNDFASYSAGFDANKTRLTIDSHAHLMGAREVTDQTYYAPRIGSYGPNWTK